MSFGPGAALRDGLAVALLLAGGRADAVRALEGTYASAARSFIVLAVTLPAQVGLLLLGFAEADAWPTSPLRWAMAHGIALAIGAVAFPLAMRPISEALGKPRAWALHVEAWNYAGLVQLGLLGLAALVEPLVPAPYDLVPGLAAALFVLRISFVVARSALGVGTGQAMLVVAAELFLAAFVGGLAQALAQ